MAIPAWSRGQRRGGCGRQEWRARRGKQEVKAVVAPTDRSGLIGPIGLVDRLSTMGAVGTAGELQDRGAVDQAVEERSG